MVSAYDLATLKGLGFSDQRPLNSLPSVRISGFVGLKLKSGTNIHVLQVYS